MHSFRLALRLTPIMIAGLVVGLAANGCRAVPMTSAERTTGQPKPPGSLVDIGGYRLHALQQGRGEPAVVFIPGAGDGSMHWSLVQPEVARFARTVSFDPAGMAWSDLGPIPRTLRQEAHDLHLLLAKLRVKPPYLLVGHSMGGLVAREFAYSHPDDVAGIVLVDATDPDTTLILGNQENGTWVNKLVRIRETAKARSIPPPQSMASSPPAPPTQKEREEWEQIQKMFGPPKIEPPFNQLPEWAQAAHLWARAHPKLARASEDYLAEELAAMFERTRRDPQPLGDRPLVVLTGRNNGGNPPPGIPAPEWTAAMEEKNRQKEEMANLSGNGLFVRDPKGGHHLHLDNPALVIASIQAAIHAARKGTRPTSPAFGQDQQTP